MANPNKENELLLKRFRCFPTRGLLHLSVSSGLDSSGKVSEGGHITKLDFSTISGTINQSFTVNLNVSECDIFDLHRQLSYFVSNQLSKTLTTQFSPQNRSKGHGLSHNLNHGPSSYSVRVIYFLMVDISFRTDTLHFYDMICSPDIDVATCALCSSDRQNKSMKMFGNTIHHTASVHYNLDIQF